MKDQIKWVLNTMPKSDDRQLSIMSLSNVAKARFFPQHLPPVLRHPWTGWTAWPNTWGWPACASKKESFRFGLNAFKVLGGSFAMAKVHRQGDGPGRPR